jgi:SAM-dependent methyltransferase
VQVLGLAERYFDSVVFFGLHELGVYRAFDEHGPCTFDALHQHIGGERETFRALLDAGVALGVALKEGDSYFADEALLDCVARKNHPAYVGEWVDFLAAFVSPLMRMPEAVRTGKPPADDHLAAFESGDTPESRLMTKAMDSYARSRGVEIGRHLNFDGVNTLLDLGCGPGTYSIAIVERNPALQATLLDLAGPIAEAKRLAAERGVSDRITFVAEEGEHYRPDHGFDAVLVSNVLHMLGPEKSPSMIAHCWDLLNPGGRLIVQAQYLNDDRVSPRWPTLVSLMQRAVTTDGRNHSLGETEAWMQAAGFRDVERVRFSLWNVCSVLIGYKPRNDGKPA